MRLKIRSVESSVAGCLALPKLRRCSGTPCGHGLHASFHWPAPPRPLLVARPLTRVCLHPLSNVHSFIPSFVRSFAAGVSSCLDLPQTGHPLLCEVGVAVAVDVAVDVAGHGIPWVHLKLSDKHKNSNVGSLPPDHEPNVAPSRNPLVAWETPTASNPQRGGPGNNFLHLQAPYWLPAGTDGYTVIKVPKCSLHVPAWAYMLRYVVSILSVVSRTLAHVVAL